MTCALVLLIGFCAGYLWGARRGGAAWMAAFWCGGEAGIRVTLDAFDDSLKGGGAVGPKARFEAAAEAERRAR